MRRTSNRGGCCCCSCSCIFSLGLTAFLLYFYIHSSTPICSIEEFDVFALKVNQTTPQNNTIHYDLKLKNRNFNKGIYYDALNLTFFYKPNLTSSFPFGNASFSPFYQGYGKSTHRIGNVESLGVKWENVTSPVVFRAELATAVRYKGTFWKSKHHHHLVVGADLKVNDNVDQGSLIKEKGNKGIKLVSSARKIRKGSFKLILGIFIISWYY